MQINYNGMSQIDAILVQGDHIVHGLSTASTATNNWPVQKAMMERLVELLKTKFPTKPIYLCIGNNDVLQHYQAAADADKAMYYGDLLDMWFTNVPTNAALASSVTSSMLSGGYYTVDLTTNLGLIVLNTIHFSVRNNADLSTATTQLSWLSDILTNAPANKKYLISMHIPPSMFFFQSLEDFWRQTYKDIFSQIITDNRDKIHMILGAHIHQADIRAPLSTTQPTLKPIPLILTPSVSPIYYNNPGYSIMDFDQNNGYSTSLVNWRFFQLYEYTLTRTLSTSFITTDPQALFNVHFSDAATIQTLQTRLSRDAQLFGVYLAAKMGYRWLFQQGGGLFYPLAKVAGKMETFQQNYVCAMRYMDVAGYDGCKYVA
ncbi:hypothetical protein FGO68_gene3108 [Halteria grandinella]|uniref:Calcineurin-like phosphoesterase domain-containing protein n=1 Tax=Halteria grandinella TaxID=5974 RepID=A0A8J8T268_HALGN|nr:hypothetical protein FGO68_gene3108 [Halteria grandinella]